MDNIPESSHNNIHEERGGANIDSQKHNQNIPPYFQNRNIAQQPIQTHSVQQSFMDYFKLPNTNASQIFSSPFGLLTWFFGLKWYIILFIIVFGMFLFFQIESAIESRKNNRKNNQNKMKEGMKPDTVERMKGIIRYSENEYKKNISKKNVSFNDDDLSNLKDESGQSLQRSKSVGRNEVEGFSNHPNMFHRTNVEPMQQIYNWWIRPWVYTVFRNIGVQ